MNIAIVLSGGSGTRLGASIPKQYIKVYNKPIIMYCVETLLGNPHIDALVICLAESWKNFVLKYIKDINSCKPIYYAQGGKTRQLSIFNALKKLEQDKFQDNDIVLIHDSARPRLSDELINRCINVCKKHDGVLPILPIKDTIYLSKDKKHISGLLDRNELFAGQAPEAFKFGKYLSIHNKMPINELKNIKGSTEIAYKFGLDIAITEGDEKNFKITTMEDLELFEQIVQK